MTSRLGFCGSPVCVALALLAWGMTGTASAKADVNSIHAGSTSVQLLTFGGSQRSPAFANTGLYLKWHFLDRTALRLGATLYLDESSGGIPVLPPQFLQIDRYYTVTASAEINQYIDPNGQVTVFLGAGPYWSRSRSIDQATYFYPTDSLTISSLNRYEMRYTELGGSVAAGFEWFFKRRLSMLGRAGGSFGFGRKSYTSIHSTNYPSYREDRYRTEIKTATAGTAIAALGLAFYF